MSINYKITNYLIIILLYINHYIIIFINIYYNLSTSDIVQPVQGTC